MELITLLRHETKTLIKETLSDETSTIQIMPQGNALLCHAFYRSGSGSVSLNFYQFTTSKDLGERTVIGTINLTEFSTAAKPITLLSIHDRVMMEVVVTGTVEIGVLATVIDQFAIEGAEVKQYLEGHSFSDTQDKATIIGTIDNNDLVKFGRSLDERLLVDSDFSLKNTGRVSELVVNDSTWVEIPRLSGRRALSIQNPSDVSVKINYVDDVGYIGMEIQGGEERSYDKRETIVMYARSQSGNVTLNIEEIG